MLDGSLRVSDNMKFVGTHLQSPASPPVFAGLLISTYLNVGPKVPSESACEKIKDVPSNAVGSTGCGLKLGPGKIGRLSMV